MSSKDKKTDDHRLKELEEKCQEYLNGWQRAQADYQNLKKETDQKIGDLKEFIEAGLLLKLLPIYDHYKMALNHIPQDQESTDWVQGLQHIKKDFDNFFKQGGIERIKTAGQQFNPEFHEAVSQEESDQPEDTIIKEVSSGYKMNGLVIRPAKVIVSKKHVIADKHG